MYCLFSLLILPLINLIAGFPQAKTPASLTRIASFGRNPSGVSKVLQSKTNGIIKQLSQAIMYVYVPDSVVDRPPIIVAIHYCAGSAWGYYEETPYARLADEYGFIVIYPSSPHVGGCWDVSSTKSLTHNGGGDSNAIANMVRYTLAKYNADPDKVFVVGSSSGAMMTVRFWFSRTRPLRPNNHNLLLTCYRMSWLPLILSFSPLRSFTLVLQLAVFGLLIIL